MSAAITDQGTFINRHSVLPFTQESDRSILIVDDDDAVRKLFKMHLCQRYPCATAATVDEALWMMEKASFALVLTDVNMPGRSGVELVREVANHYPETVVVVISGVDRAQRVLDTVRIGAYDYLLKPVDLDVLELTVERALERRLLLCEARAYKQDLERRNAELEDSKAKLEKLQAQIFQTEKMASLGQLAAGVAHELNNPAGFIYGNMEILRECADELEQVLKCFDSLELTAQQAAEIEKMRQIIDFQYTLTTLRSIVDDCHEGAGRIRDVVQNLRVFSRLDEADYKKVDIHEGLESTIRLLARYFNTGQVKLEREYGALPLVDCFAGQLNQVWLNLLVNAAQALKDGGTVRITTRREADRVSVSISDNGCGIAPENLGRIFDPFYTTKPVGEGTGLGLSVTYSIVERHQGKIKVESTPGQGTTFIIDVPIDSGTRVPEAGSAVFTQRIGSVSESLAVLAKE